MQKYARHNILHSCVVKIGDNILQSNQCDRSLFYLFKHFFLFCQQFYYYYYYYLAKKNEKERESQKNNNNRLCKNRFTVCPFCVILFINLKSLLLFTARSARHTYMQFHSFCFFIHLLKMLQHRYFFRIGTCVCAKNLFINFFISTTNKLHDPG